MTSPTDALPGHGGSPSIALADDYWWYTARAAMLRSYLSSYAVTAQRALDIGSADAPSARWFRESVPETVCLDIDPRGLTGDAVCGSALDLPFADGSFDVVAAFDVIEHLDPEQRGLAEVHRVLRPGGFLLLSVPAYQWAWSDHDTANGHHRRYTRGRAVAAVTRAGFTVSRSSYAFAATFPFFAGERLLRRALREHSDSAHDIVEVPSLPRAVERGLLHLCRLDDAALRRGLTLPFGSSVFLAARR